MLTSALPTTVEAILCPRDALFANAIYLLTEILQAKDPEAKSHAARVTAYASAIARELGFSAAELEALRVGAELHDIGKVGVPEELLRRPGPLAPAEYRRVLEHTVIGEAMLRPVLRDHPTALAVVRWHHERLDGGGFPDGLRGDAIPLAARIVCAADAFDAMTCERPYRAPLSWAGAMRELERAAGSQFDADCVEALLNWNLRADPTRQRGLRIHRACDG